jgi:hypothetical protein
MKNFGVLSAIVSAQQAKGRPLSVEQALNAIHVFNAEARIPRAGDVLYPYETKGLVQDGWIALRGHSVYVSRSVGLWTIEKVV